MKILLKLSLNNLSTYEIFLICVYKALFYYVRLIIYLLITKKVTKQSRFDWSMDALLVGVKKKRESEKEIRRQQLRFEKLATMKIQFSI